MSKAQSPQGAPATAAGQEPATTQAPSPQGAPATAARAPEEPATSATRTRTFQGRPVVPGTVTAEALVSHGGLNTLASYQSALLLGDKDVKCGDQNNPDLYKKPMLGRALCLPETIGSTTGGMVLYCAAALGKQPACLLFSKTIDPLAASGAVLAATWCDASMPVVDELGEEFLAYVRDGMQVSVDQTGLVTIEEVA